ncbi:hypothetical protein F5Y13DRAFT_158929 [Hypoxylon sp. FL1857]|nr:hypothetical protein F5Y13DRAFT_158929 [Hypoxylon sp. FL1857]
MNHNLVVKWAGRMRPCLLSSSQTACPRSYQLAARSSQQQHQSLSRVAYTPIPFARRQFSSCTARQSSEAQNIPTGESQPQEPSSSSPHSHSHSQKRTNWKPWILFNAAGLSTVIMTALVLKSATSSADDPKNAVINKTSFSPFTITAREQVSPTAFILSICPGEASNDIKRSWAPLKEAWDHGLWSVEIKQPQLQIARHYTPLPPLAGDDGDGNSNENENEELRFLIRRMDGGEMSTYLSKLRVGDQVWLRGPHLGFDVDRRLGAAENVVFLAGGTGIAPALQVARRLLEDGGHKEMRRNKPTISILWANRRAADALGRQQPQAHGAAKGSWFPSLWGKETPSGVKEEQAQPEESSLARQIRELEQKHPGRFQISYLVDEEGSFIGPRDLGAALGEARKSSLLPAAQSCPWHSAAALEKLPDDNDAGRHALACACAQDGKNAPTEVKVGANLICVSGPDGFIEAYAGPKRWHGGTEMQGPVRGVLGRIIKETQGENWLVLKL